MDCCGHPSREPGSAVHFDIRMNGADRRLDKPVGTEIDVIPGGTRYGKSARIQALVAHAGIRRGEAHLIEIPPGQGIRKKVAPSERRIDAGERHLEIAGGIGAAEILGIRFDIAGGRAHMNVRAVAAEIEPGQVLTELKSAVALPNIGFAPDLTGFRAGAKKERLVDRSVKRAGRGRIDTTADRATPDSTAGLIRLGVRRAGNEGVALRQKGGVHRADRGRYRIGRAGDAGNILADERRAVKAAVPNERIGATVRAQSLGCSPGRPREGNREGSNASHRAFASRLNHRR